MDVPLVMITVKVIHVKLVMDVMVVQAAQNVKNVLAVKIALDAIIAVIVVQLDVQLVMVNVTQVIRK